MDEDADPAEKINELLGAVAALKAYIAHLPGAADVDLEAVRRAGRDTGGSFSRSDNEGTQSPLE